MAQHWHVPAGGVTLAHDRAEMGMHFALSSEQFIVVIVLTLQMMRELSPVTLPTTRPI